jgi:uncharacterized damage-inducible protein DinB
MDIEKYTDIDEILAGLSRSPKILAALLTNIPEEMLKVRRIPGKWSIHEHACHLVDVQPMLIERIKAFKHQEHPVFKPYLPGDTDSDAHLIQMALAEALPKFAVYRHELAGLVGTFQLDDLEKHGQHDEYTLYTPHILLRHILMHDHLHMYRIEELWLTTDAYLAS